MLCDCYVTVYSGCHVLKKPMWTRDIQLTLFSSSSTNTIHTILISLLRTVHPYYPHILTTDFHPHRPTPSILSSYPYYGLSIHTILISLLRTFILIDQHHPYYPHILTTDFHPHRPTPSILSSYPYYGLSIHTILISLLRTVELFYQLFIQSQQNDAQARSQPRKQNRQQSFS